LIRCPLGFLQQHGQAFVEPARGWLLYHDSPETTHISARDAFIEIRKDGSKSKNDLS
jgi:hypothetical protein